MDRRESADPVLPPAAREDTDEGWGAELDDGDTTDPAERWYRSERPPHHDR